MDRQNQFSQVGQILRDLTQGVNPRRRKKSDENSGGAPAPKTGLRIGPDRRAQAVLRAANRPKSQKPYLDGTVSSIRNPAVGIQADKFTEPSRSGQGTDSSLSFHRIKPGNNKYNGAFSTKSDIRRFDGAKPQTAHGLHKDRLRSAAVKHAMGRQMTDIRPGNRVEATTVTSSGGRNPRGRIYEKLSNGVLNFEKGKRRLASATKMTKDTWQPHKFTDSGDKHPIVRFNPNTLKDPLKALAQSTVVRATARLVGGPVAQPVLAVDDAIAAASGKRPSKELAKQHIKTQSLLIKQLQKRKKIQAPWVGSGPF